MYLCASQCTIQTKAGPVLVAINPFKKVPLYGNDYIEAYKRKAIESPHVYAITDTAIREMIRGNLLFLYIHIHGCNFSVQDHFHLFYKKLLTLGLFSFQTKLINL